MKFLLFNAVVIGALVYLFSDDPKQLSNPETFSKQTLKIVEKAKNTVKASARIIKEKVKMLADSDQTAPPDPEPIPVVDEPAPPLPPAREIEPRIVHPVPVFTAERRIFEQPAPKTPVLKAEIAEQPKFMTPRQRRRELNKLAHEMELMFADKLSN